MNTTFLQYFRCPDRYTGLTTAERLSAGSGFFSFADGAVGYGRYVDPGPASSPQRDLPNAWQAIDYKTGFVGLPFDLDEVVENLRLERYTEDREYGSSAENLLSKIYYMFRPLLPVGFRRHLQRAYLGDWTKIAFPGWPVDHSVDSILHGCMQLMLRNQRLEKIPFIWFWPEGAAACAIMTHDVETAEGRDYCSNLMDMNQSFGMPASFQVVPEERYDVTERYLDSIRERGFEVNVQDLNHDGRLYRDRIEFLRRAAKINEYGRRFKAAGFRSAVLYRRQEWYSDLDFSYDMSVPSSGHLEPQRGGCCTVMPYFVGSVLELPVTTTQDYSLFNYVRTHSIDLWQTQIDLILRKHGLMSFIVHPDYIIGRKEGDTYQQLLACLRSLQSERNVWMPTPGEVDSWWRQRSQMTLVEDGDGWRIEGNGSERARVAYASERDGALEFCLAPATSRIPV
jgi:hypothetical protein